MTAASFYYGGLRALGVTAANRAWRNAGVILCYHNVLAGSPRGGDPGLHMQLPTFERQVRWLSSRYDVVPLATFVARVRSGAALRGTAAITFDDGYRGVFEHALPCLRALGLTATVFVVPGAVGRRRSFWWDRPDIVAAAGPVQRDRWLGELGGDEDAILAGRGAAPAVDPAFWPADWPAIRAAAADGFDIGVHSTTHRSLPGLDDAELHAEIVGSRAAIEREVGTRPNSFSYPYGRWNRRVARYVRESGYAGAVTLDGGLNGSGADVWSLGRVNVPASISDAAFEAWAAGLEGSRVACASRT
jgi:peptidoglycan/xylan/chitin deacetylase (PgdA/CDA1 family)